MTFMLDEADQNYLLGKIRSCDVALILGAGASYGGTNQFGKPIKTGLSLAKLFAEKAGLSYSNDSLTDVIEAARGRLSEIEIRSILNTEYTKTTPSDTVNRLFNICWRRVYTFNIDDSLDFISGSNLSQRRRYFNGLIDKVADFEGPRFVHIVHLHGQAAKPEHGFIFSETEYSNALKNAQLHWYRRAGLDYLTFCPVFIGTQLDEPILWAEIERAKREENSTAGLGFLITPSKLSPIKKESLRRRGIVHVNATIEGFVAWLRRHFPRGWGVQDVVRAGTSFSRLDDLTPEDLNVANSIKLVDLKGLRDNLAQIPPNELAHRGRMFLRGFPPTWLLAASDVPVWLKAAEGLLGNLERKLSERAKLFVVAGQAGSGKTTALMMSLLRYIEKNPVKVYEFSGGGASIGKIISVLRKLGDPCILYISDLFLFGDALADELEKISMNDNITIVASTRSGEWNTHFSRYLGRFCDPYNFSRFLPADHAPLIERLTKYVPAPRFIRLRKEQQLKLIAKSKSQLLIALHEVTESENFGATISHEFEKLPDADVRFLFLLVGIGTMARVGVSLQTARESYSFGAENRSIERSLEALSGIVERTDDDQLFARHEIYVRHILENSINVEEFVAASVGLLRTFTQYDVPIIKKVNRRDGILFKFLLNNDFIFQTSKRLGSTASGRGIYEQFEIDFQLDGHFWLQYGLYLQRLGHLDGALDMLKKSIDAYPDNSFAHHALAQLQLRLAYTRPILDRRAEELLQDAVRTLEVLATRGPLVLDTYPLVTLAVGHVGVLAKHGRSQEARKLAGQYHARLQDMARTVDDLAIRRAQEAMLRYATLNEMPRPFGESMFTPRAPRKGVSSPSARAPSQGPQGRRR